MLHLLLPPRCRILLVCLLLLVLVSLQQSMFRFLHRPCRNPKNHHHPLHVVLRYLLQQQQQQHQSHQLLWQRRRYNTITARQETWMRMMKAATKVFVVMYPQRLLIHSSTAAETLPPAAAAEAGIFDKDNENEFENNEAAFENNNINIDCNIHSTTTTTSTTAAICYASSMTTRNNDNIDAAEELALLYGEPQEIQGFTPTNSSHSATIASEASSFSSSTLALYWLQLTDVYMRNEVFVQDRYKDVRTACRNQRTMCTHWASMGECDKNPGHMRLQCAPACRSCHDLIFEERCPMPYNVNDRATRTALNALKEVGDLHAFFERLVTHPDHQIYQPVVLHRPPIDPWIIVFDQFLSEHECNVLIELGATLGYQGSTLGSEKKSDGSYTTGQPDALHRTSTAAWCVSEACYANATVQNVLQRIANVTGIPDAHSEYLQLLKYEVGQFYVSHHDFIARHVPRAQGPRILTIFLYLNDVEAGGATHFTDLNVSVSPQRGRALIWPSVLDEPVDKDDPNNAVHDVDDDPSELFVTKDPRTHHQALPVEAGIKYGANAWVHLRDYKTPRLMNCV